jgi:hypothetical protein
LREEIESLLAPTPGVAFQKLIAAKARRDVALHLKAMGLQSSYGRTFYSLS